MFIVNQHDHIISTTLHSISDFEKLNTSIYSSLDELKKEYPNLSSDFIQNIPKLVVEKLSSGDFYSFTAPNIIPELIFLDTDTVEEWISKQTMTVKIV